MSRKGLSILPFAFIALVVSLGIISWSFYNVYYGSKYQATVFEHSKIDTVENELERGKKFLKQSCIYSSHQALLENAAGGGIVPVKGGGPNTWICNSPMPSSTSKTKSCLGRYTKFYTNIYYGKYDVDLPVDIAKSKYKEAKYNISSESIFGGKYDSGNIKVSLDGAKISLSTDDIQITDNLAQNVLVDKNRFWYLWRNFHKWSQRNVYGKGICDCTSSCGGCNCAEKAAEEALKDLEKRFDDFVECEKSRSCCYGCEGSAGGIIKVPNCGMYCGPSKCLPWVQATCFSNCNSNCVNPSKRHPETASDLQFNKSQVGQVRGGVATNELPPQGKTDGGKSGPKKPKPRDKLRREKEQEKTKTEKEEKPSEYHSADVKPPDKEQLEEEKEFEKKPSCPVYFENKLSSVYTFSCTDKKYYVPGKSGPKPLTFQVKVFASYRDKDGCGCQMKRRCPCPENMGETCS